MTRTGFTRWGVVVMCMAAPSLALSQAAPHQSGTVKSASSSGLTLTNAAGQDYTVSVPATATVLLVAPGKAAKDAVPGTVADVTVNDKAIVIGTPTDTGTSLTATKIYLMKASAIAQSHAADEAAWTRGAGGIVKSVDVAGSKVELSSGGKTITVVVTPSTVVRHYSDSVAFADAKLCALTDVKVGDQLRVRGTKTMDGSSISADEMVAGTFHNYSGLLTAVDAAAGTVTLKDLATKKTVTVSVTAGSDVHRIAPQMAQMLAVRMKATSGATPGAQAAPAGGTGQRGPQGAGRGGADLSQMLPRLPKETVAGLKTGEAVMIVATSPSSDPTKSTAVTLVVGVEPMLTASPAGDVVLSPWSLGAAPGGEGGGR